MFGERYDLESLWGDAAKVKNPQAQKAQGKKAGLKKLELILGAGANNARARFNSEFSAALEK